MRTPEDAPTDPDRMIRLGTVASVDLAAARTTITLDDGATSPPLRWIEHRNGATASWSPPSVGEQVVLLCPGGEIGAGLVLRGIPSDAHPPAGNSATEIVRFADGAVISYDPQGHALVAMLPAGATVAVTAAGGLTFTGPVAIDGDVSITGAVTATGDITGMGTSLHTHKHSQVAGGSAVSGPPQ